MGDRTNPSMRHLHGLCSFFGVPIGYFFDEELEARVDAELELAASLRHPAVRQLAMHASGLSPEALQAITQIIDHARRIEGLDGVRNRAGGSNGPRPALYPRRRGRRARARDGETRYPETPAAPEAI